jgi:hypothetical protein
MRLTKEQFWNLKLETHERSRGMSMSVRTRKGFFSQVVDNARYRGRG